MQYNLSKFYKKKAPTVELFLVYKVSKDVLFNQLLQRFQLFHINF